MLIKEQEVTILNRLKLELSNKEYYSDDIYKTLLEENNLVWDDDYNKEVHEINLLNTVVAILETLANDVDMMRKIDTNGIMSVDQASKYLSQRIYNIKNKIIEIEESKEEYNGNINPIFFTR